MATVRDTLVARRRPWRDYSTSALMSTVAARLGCLRCVGGGGGGLVCAGGIRVVGLAVALHELGEKRVGGGGVVRWVG